MLEGHDGDPVGHVHAAQQVCRAERDGGAGLPRGMDVASRSSQERLRAVAVEHPADCKLARQQAQAPSPRPARASQRAAVSLRGLGIPGGGRLDPSRCVRLLLLLRPRRAWNMPPIPQLGAFECGAGAWVR